MKSISHDEIHTLQNPLLIDVRSPGEYQEDHLPGAINLPVLDDDQRGRVGTLYHQESTFEARQVGARLIAGNLPNILETIEERAGADRPVVIYCWRGGMRSESLGVILERIGYPTYRVDGGYKSYRRTVHEYFQNGKWDLEFVSVFGLTGCGKTALLERLSERGQSIVDLEGLANHRGSAFGAVGRDEQPSQKAFENRLYQSLIDLSPPVFIEGESRHVGAVRIPDSLFDEVTSPPRIWMETTLERRVNVIRDEYDWPESREELIDRLDDLRERLGHEQVDKLQDKLSQNRVRPVVRELLESYYDPAYRNSCPDRDDFDLTLNGDDLEQACDTLLKKVADLKALRS
jgi:tRNA 2-selenouridine synthase